MSDEALVTAQRLCNLFPKANLQERYVSGLLAKDGIENVKRKGYAFRPAIECVIAHFKRLYEARDIAGESARERKNKAEADSAEADALEKTGRLCPMDSAKQFWADARIEVRQTIERANYLTPVQKTKLLSEISALHPKLEIEA